MDSVQGFREFWVNKNHVSQGIFIVSALYCVSAVVVLLLVLGIWPLVPKAHLNPYLLIGFTIVSFGLTLFISAYHLSTMLKRRKRKTDSR